MQLNLRYNGCHSSRVWSCSSKACLELFCLSFWLSNRSNIAFHYVFWLGCQLFGAIIILTMHMSHTCNRAYLAGVSQCYHTTYRQKLRILWKEIILQLLILSNFLEIFALIALLVLLQSLWLKIKLRVLLFFPLANLDYMF